MTKRGTNERTKQDFAIISQAVAPPCNFAILIRPATLPMRDASALHPDPSAWDWTRRNEKRETQKGETRNERTETRPRNHKGPCLVRGSATW